MEKVYDAHVHHLFEIPLDEAEEIFKEEFSATGTEKFIFLSIPHETDKDKRFITTDHMQNLKALYLKRAFSPNGYAFAGLIHPDSYSDTEATSLELRRQAEEYMRVGFDGIKMLEGYPSLLKLRGILLDHPVFDAFYSFCEEKSVPITAHVANPAENWDISRASRQAIEAGRVYDLSYPTKGEITASLFRALDKHPRLRLSLAHFGFLTYDINEAERFLGDYENTILDITPGGEQLLNIASRLDEWLPFIEKYKDRIVYGTDFYAFPRDENYEICFRRRPDFIRRLFETDGEHLYIDRAFKGISLDKRLRDRIYRENFMRLYPSPREIDSSWLVSRAEEILKEESFLHTIDKRDAEYILDRIQAQSFFSP